MNQCRPRRLRPKNEAEYFIRASADNPAFEASFINTQKGRGVLAKEFIHKGQFVLEYRGELITQKDCEARLSYYSDKELVFLFDFKWKEKCWCVDASKEDGSLGRLVNDDRKHPNCKMKIVEVKGRPHLCLFALRNIMPGEELHYDYGEADWPWRMQITEEKDAGGESNQLNDFSAYKVPAQTAKCFPMSTYIHKNKEVDRSELEKQRALLSWHLSQIDNMLASKTNAVPASSTHLPEVSEPHRIELDESDVEKDSDPDYIPNSSSTSSDEGDDGRSRSTSPNKSLYRKQFPRLSSTIQTSLESKSCSNDITVPATLTSTKKRIYDKKQHRLFCGKQFYKIARHLLTVHHKETEVIKASMHPKNSRERRLQLNQLRKRGNFAHNIVVVHQGSGEMTACYRPSQRKSSKDFIHCVYCQGLYSKRTLWKHVKSCPLKVTNDSKSQSGRKYVRSLSALSTPVGLPLSKGLKDILCNMTYDEVSLIVKNDKCILQLGEHFFRRMGSDQSKHDYIRQKLRELGRLLQEATRITPLRQIEDFIIPANYPHVISAVKALCVYDEKNNSYGVPSLALKLGHSLNKICSIVESNAIIEGNRDLADSAAKFRQVHQVQWNKCISSGAINTLKEAKLNTPQLLPFAHDVKQLHMYLESKQKEAEKELVSCASRDRYCDLAHATLAQVILFNRRREEVSRMHVKDFISRDQTKLHDDIAICLSKLERKLCNHFTRIEIKGKRGRKVPVLLKPRMVNAVELLLANRKKCGVPEENPFLFARPGTTSAFRGRDAIHKFAKECGSKCPEALTSTKLRKHIATMSKVLNLKENEADQLADFLGHDIRVHREYYRLPEGTLQLAKMSKILMAMERGSLQEFKGQKLDDIKINPDEKLDTKPDDQTTSEDDESDSEEPTVSSPDSDDAVPSSPVMPLEKQKLQPRKWNEDEIKAVERHMMKFIRMCKVPKKDCLQCLKAEMNALGNRTWTGV